MSWVPEASLVNEDLEMSQVFETLAAAKATARAESDCLTYFVIVPIGGNWSARNLGVAFDSYRGKVTTNESVA